MFNYDYVLFAVVCQHVLILGHRHTARIATAALNSAIVITAGEIYIWEESPQQEHTQFNLERKRLS